MKAAMGELNLTVVTIIILALLLGLAMVFFSGENSLARNYIQGQWDKMTNRADNALD